MNRLIATVLTPLAIFRRRAIAFRSRLPSWAVVTATGLTAAALVGGIGVLAFLLVRGVDRETRVEPPLTVGPGVTVPLLLDGDRLGVSALDGGPAAEVTGPGMYKDVRYDAAGRLLFLQWAGSETGFYRVEDGKLSLVIPVPPASQQFPAEWSPDGTKAAWIEPDAGSTRLHVAEPGSEARTLGPEGLVAFLWSPDGRSLLAWSGGSDSTTYVLDAAAATPVVAVPLAGSLLGWSRAGDVLAWEQVDAAQARRVVLVKTDGTDRRILGEVTLPYEGGGPTSAFSPDGRWLAFDTATASGFVQGLLVAASDDSGVFRPRCDSCAAGSQGGGPAWSSDGKSLAWSQAGHVVVAETGVWEGRVVAEGFSPRWAPDGSSIAYTRIDGGRSTLYARRLDGNEEVKVVDLEDARGIDEEVAWSPDGRHLIVPLQVSETSQVLSFDPATGEVRELPTPVLSMPDLSTAALAPDGSAIVYWQPEELVLVTPDGKQHAVDRTAAGAMPTAWSRDGKRMLVVGSQGLTSLDLATGQVTKLLDGNIQDAVWSPDGSRVAFVRDQRLGVLDLGSGEARIIVPDLTAIYLPNYYGLGHLAWSPDGESIAFGDWHIEDPVTQGRSDVYVIDADGSNLRRLTDSPLAKSYFAFSPDGRYLAYVHSLADGDHLKVIAVDSGAESPVDAPTSVILPPRWVGPDALLVNNYRGISIAKVDSSELLLVAATGGCRRNLIGWAAGRLVFASTCTHRGL